MSMLLVCGTCIYELVAKDAFDASSEQSLRLLVKPAVLDQPIVRKKQGFDQYKAFIEDENLEISRNDDV